MAEIKLEGMSFYAHHGYYTHEQIRGNEYRVDVSLDADVDQAAIDDELGETINYERIYQICQAVMDVPCKLIETVAYRIAHEVRQAFPAAANIRVVVHKMAPELGGPVHSARITYVLD